METDIVLVETGCCGQYDVALKKNGFRIHKQDIPMSTLPFGLPPRLETETAKIEKYLTEPEKLPIQVYKRCQKFWPRTPCPESLYNLDHAPVQTTIQVERNPTTGEFLSIKEEYVPDAGSTAQNSTSLMRPPGSPSLGAKGSATNYPFWPGGLDEPTLDNDIIPISDAEAVDFENNLLTTPPGFSMGMTFGDKVDESGSVNDRIPNIPVVAHLSTISIADVLTRADAFEFFPEKHPRSKVEDEEATAALVIPRSESLENIVKKVEDAPKPAPWVVEEQKKVWGIHVDISTPVEDFHKRIPEMAYKWPFELDTFQKQAILHLENHESVLVAAHTSAGKTVVAEYAIALSMKHMTRTVYTSPIKALSNQKFRDFRLTFGDVGLITGDVQIKQEAACLIMTTEILRSMLYNGSEVIRDLEWVVFDEVHYINNEERGVVWEEVLIMLPPHVNIIMLSATVPNTIEFAEWVGRTKRKKIFVISTLKRPVPLEHYLYTGNSNKTSNELFLLVDAEKKFLTNAYTKAVEAKKERQSKSQQSFGPKGQRGGSASQDKNVWLSVINMLEKKDKLPVIAFTLSRKRIDENTHHLQSVDLTTQKQKAAIHLFCERCIAKLKGSDKKLPQVLEMTSMLKRGIGKHHSGILPIMKEMVEMLFQKGLVKVLFATETFAIGVNMPARTVVFDSIRKHDGTCFRNLLPGEYIQMAGRAGRRGLDTTGTVIVMCKGDVPETAELHIMMLGKPTKLESQFRLTYSMILNLLRVEKLRVQDMMKRSFSETTAQQNVETNKKRLEELKGKLARLEPVECFTCSEDIENYYSTCFEYDKLKKKLQKVVFSHPLATKAMTAGRVVVVKNHSHKNAVGVILKVSQGSNNERSYATLVLCERGATNFTKQTKKNLDGLEPFGSTELFLPKDCACGQMIEILRADDISVITKKQIKINAEKIIDDVRKRELPRFRDNPPGSSTSSATQELLQLTESNPTGLPGLDAVDDLRIRDIELVEQFRQLQVLEGLFENFNCIKCAKFSEHFNHMKNNMQVQEEYKLIKHLLSDDSLQLLPEYEQRIQVLRDLNYIDDTNTVTLKGRVACEINSHELLITESLFHDAFNGLQPAEIAGILSCTVFEQKNCGKPELSDALQKGKERICAQAENIGVAQRDAGLKIPVREYVDQLKFGLTEAVFEWSRGMPFSDITNLVPDVQEGIIVRCIQRLDEMLRDVRKAAKIIGDPVLQSKMEEASTLIKRDIVFAASLYTQT
ncbi:superkiller complex protein 2-like [Lineus longissimus]|uniref:superkiller complex protein 2-like n=1 Tax=Lineus longissimus TaxID=88925 RepID=UPI002B4C5BAD